MVPHFLVKNQQLVVVGGPDILTYFQMPFRFYTGKLTIGVVRNPPPSRVEFCTVVLITCLGGGQHGGHLSGCSSQ